MSYFVNGNPANQPKLPSRNESNATVFFSILVSGSENATKKTIRYSGGSRNFTTCTFPCWQEYRENLSSGARSCEMEKSLQQMSDCSGHWALRFPLPLRGDTLFARMTSAPAQKRSNSLISPVEEISDRLLQ